MERLLAGLQSKEFGSVEEAREYIARVYGEIGMPDQPRKQTPLEKPQQCIYEAWEVQGEERVRLALKALKICGDWADAYVIFAEEVAGNIDEALEMYEQGVRAGERALGETVFTKGAGQFWGLLERPYMRARAGLAGCLWMTGRREEAIGHYEDMLRLNPNDNQGIRYLLLNGYLKMDRNDEAGKLLNAYDEESACWLYSKAVFLFRREKNSKRAHEVLKQAIKENRFVPPYLIGIKTIPAKLPRLIGFGDENEAIAYAADALQIWQKTPYACQWLSNIWGGGQL